MSAIYVFGCGGHGKVVAESIRATRDGELRGFLDDDPSRHGTSVLGVPVVGGAECLGRLTPPFRVALAIGSNSQRLRILAELEVRGIELVSAIHPAAVVVSSATVGHGSYVGPRAVVHVDARLGEACIVNSGAIVEHDCVLGRGVHVAPGGALGGNVRLDEGVFVGMGAVVLPGLHVGAHAIVGAGAAVVRDVPAGVTVVGVPARAAQSRAHE